MSAETFLNGRVVLHPGDSRDVLKTLADSSIDSIVTDPPYALVSIVKRFGNISAKDLDNQLSRPSPHSRASAGFMGQKWDTGETAFAVEFWAECLRVLKPGGHVVAFSGTRTYHRMACAIEDAGFDVRNMLSWNFGSGFPKSHNISKTLDDKKERCSCPTHLRGMQRDLDSSHPLSGRPQQDMRSGMLGSNDRREEYRPESGSLNPLRYVRQDDSSRAIEGEADSQVLLQRLLPEQDICGEAETICCERVGKAPSGEGIEGREERGMEGRCDLSQTSRELRQRSLRPMSGGPDLDGSDGRLRDGTSASDGALDRASVDADRMRSPPRPQAAKQSAIELGALAGQSQPQTGRAWEDCGRCGKPLVPDGLGTDLKPAHEPICLARKPLAANTIAANVLLHGTGAINIDGCRVESGESTARPLGHNAYQNGQLLGKQSDHRAAIQISGGGEGRWPANIIHDGSEEVIAAFPDAGGGFGKRGGQRDSEYGFGGTMETVGYGDEGSAARFFYTAKADSDDRLGSKHPTVKPVDLMQWLCRLVTPKGGTVLDPFAGTGTTGEAAFREGFNSVLIEREEEYQADIRRRMALVMAGPDERKRESIKAKVGDLPFEAGSLFAGLGAAE